MKTNLQFGGLEDKYSSLDTASVWLQSIPYDGTSTWGKGADQAFEAFIDASENMELYDIETDSEVYKKGIHTLPELSLPSDPKQVYLHIKEHTKSLLKQDKFLTFLGGEHSISIGIIEAFSEQYEHLSVLQLDAHSDLRKDYMGTPYNHACAMHQANILTNLVQVGIRSMDSSEKQYVKPQNCFFAEDMYAQNDWMDESISLLTNQVYISIDFDVFDPSIMPATGTPEPGGLDWNTTIRYLRKVFAQKEVVGFDLVELAPIHDFKAPNFLAAKLYYKLLSYKYYGK